MSASTLESRVPWTGPQKLDVGRAVKPRPEPEQVVIRVESIGICGTDVAIWRGRHQNPAAGVVLGHEFGGTIVELGTNVQYREVGQVVAVDPNLTCGQCPECRAGTRGLCKKRRLMGRDVDGGLQRFVAVDATQTIIVPGEPDPRALALVEPIAVGVHACERAGVTAGSRVGIIGGGAIGMACALQARSLGAESIMVVEPDPVRREAIDSFGVPAVAPGGVPPHAWDVAIDTVGNGDTLSSTMDLVAPGSTICVAGLADGSLPSTSELVRRELTVTGTFCYTKANLHTAAALVAYHGLKALPHDLVAGLHMAPQAIEDFANGHLGLGKTLIIP